MVVESSMDNGKVKFGGSEGGRKKEATEGLLVALNLQFILTATDQRMISSSHTSAPTEAKVKPHMGKQFPTEECSNVG